MNPIRRPRLISTIVLLGVAFCGIVEVRAEDVIRKTTLLEEVMGTDEATWKRLPREEKDRRVHKAFTYAAEHPEAGGLKRAHEILDAYYELYASEHRGFGAGIRGEVGDSGTRHAGSAVGEFSLHDVTLQRKVKPTWKWLDASLKETYVHGAGSVGTDLEGVTGGVRVKARQLWGHRLGNSDSLCGLYYLGGLMTEIRMEGRSVDRDLGRLGVEGDGGILCRDNRDWMLTVGPVVQVGLPIIAGGVRVRYFAGDRLQLSGEAKMTTWGARDNDGEALGEKSKEAHVDFRYRTGDKTYVGAQGWARDVKTEDLSRPESQRVDRRKVLGGQVVLGVTF